MTIPVSPAWDNRRGHQKKPFALPDTSKLELAIPAGWKDKLKPNACKAPVTFLDNVAKAQGA